MTNASPSTEHRSHPPMWLVEGLDVVEQRRPVLIAVTIGVIAIGVVLALLAPGVVPPLPVVGAAVGLAGLLLGLAVAVALDAADLRLRGPRHVGAAGGELVAVLPTAAERDGAATLAGAVLEARTPGFPLLLGLAAAGRDVRPTTAWTDALATALEDEGVSVLRIDLASGHTTSPGLLEVVRDGVKLASVVTFSPEKKLARLGAGSDLNGALGALTALPGRLPRDLDVLLVALPMAASRQVVSAVRSLDHVLIVAQRDRTSRVELIAGLDALEAAGTRAQVALLDDRTAARLAPKPRTAARTEPAAETDPAAEPGPLAEPGPRSGATFGVGGAALAGAGIAAALTPRASGPAGSDAGDPEPAASERDDPDPAEPSGSTRRDVAVVQGAAEAAAIVLVETPIVEPSPPTAVPEVEGASPVGGEPTAGPTVALGYPPAPVELQPAAHDPSPSTPDVDADVDAEADVDADTDPDTTDEIPVLRQRAAISDADAEHEEMMRTTAQLADLLDDHHVSGDDDPADHVADRPPARSAGDPDDDPADDPTVRP